MELLLSLALEEFWSLKSKRVELVTLKTSHRNATFCLSFHGKLPAHLCGENNMVIKRAKSRK